MTFHFTRVIQVDGVEIGRTHFDAPSPPKGKNQCRQVLASLVTQYPGKVVTICLHTRAAWALAGTEGFIEPGPLVGKITAVNQLSSKPKWSKS